MPTERRVLGQTQHTEQIPLGGQQFNTMQTGTTALPINTGLATSGTSTLTSGSGFVQSSALPTTGFVQTSTLPASGFVSSSTEKLSTTSAALPINTASSGFVGTTGAVNQSFGNAAVTSNRIVEQPVLENVVERTFIEKRNLQNITEIHEQPVYEIHEKPIIENITAAAEVKRFGGQVLHEEVRQDQGFVLPAKNVAVHRTREEYVAQVNEAPKINVQHQKIVNIIEQPVITEIVNKPIVEISETNIERVIHERPIVTVVREQPITESVQTATFATGLATTATTATTATVPRTLNVTTTDTLIEERTSGGNAGFLPGATTATTTSKATGRKSTY